MKTLRIVVTLFFFAAFVNAQDKSPQPETFTIVEAKGDVARCSEGAMIELNDGSIFLIYQEFKRGKGDSDFFPGRLVAKTSKDGGRTWDHYRVMVEMEPGDTNVFSPSLLRLPNGDILFCFMRYLTFDKAINHYPPASASAWISKDDAKTFQPLATLWKELPITITSATIKQTSRGRILLPINRDPSKKGEPDRWEAAVIYSDDGGKTWTQSENWITAAKRGVMEPHVEELRDGRLLMVMRTQLGSVYQSHSADGGKTWSAATSLGVEAPESCPELIRIPKRPGKTAEGNTNNKPGNNTENRPAGQPSEKLNGDLLLIFNSKYDPKWASHFGKRTPLSAAISKDEGKTWSKPRHIETDPGSAFTNVGSLFTSKGTLVLNYWTCKYQPNGYMATDPIHLRGAIIPLHWLYDSR